MKQFLRSAFLVPLIFLASCTSSENTQMNTPALRTTSRFSPYVQTTSKVTNYDYSNTINDIKDYLINNGSYSDGTYGYVFSIFTNDSYTYVGMIQMRSSDEELWISLSQLKSDSSGIKSAQSKLFLPYSWNNGNFEFSFEQIHKDSYNVEELHNRGTGSFYGPTFNSATLLTFAIYSGETAEYVSAYYACLMLSISLDRFAQASTFSMRKLGFNYFDY